ncbi:hypothetical protein DV738_g737, partial [Chaetothyriales sp. CBS 135597]
MPQSGASKSKHKAREARRSPSRNTTPSSVISAGTSTTAPPLPPLPPLPPAAASTPFLNLETARLLVLPQPQYADILDQLEAKPSAIEPKRLQDIIEQLKTLGDHAENRVELCERAIRLIHEQMRDVESEHKDRERQADLVRRSKSRKEDAGSKNGKAKKRKDRTDSMDGVIVKTEDDAVKLKRSTPAPAETPSPSKKIKHSPGTSSLSEVADSPDQPSPTDLKSQAKSDNGFFPDPLAPDPIIYHIREVTPNMSEEEKKQIYSVTSYPTKDLSDQIAGQPPDKDFSNAKPTNQVAATTFQAYVDPYTRPLLEEDIAFLRERGDRTTPFLAVPRGKRSYQEIWAEEDGLMIDTNADKPVSSHPRGSFDALNEDNIATDQISTGPLASRLLSLLKFEHRERLRLLQNELRRVMIVNGARKARLLDLAKERLAWQEYNTIHEDLDSQVQQAYLKRTRTMGKSKKGGGPASHKPRPGSHVATAVGTAFGVAKRDIGDSARMLMDRRKRWASCIGPVFKDMKRGVPGKDTTLWDPKIMETYEKAEIETLDDEAE